MRRSITRFRRFGLAGWLLLTTCLGSAAAEEALRLTSPAPGIHLRPGQQAVASPENHGHIANLGFVIGSRSVAVIDTGGSLREGRALRRALREITDLPISHVILTHVHPDHVLGAAAFVADAPQFVGHQQLADALLRRGAYYLERLPEQIGADAAGTEVVLPDVAVADRLRIDLGGRELILTAHPTAHTNADLSIQDPQTGTLWLSDLLFVDRLPVVDGSLLGWLALGDWVASIDPQRVVPGHGPVVEDWRAALAAQTRYLQTLATDVRALIRQRVGLAQAVGLAAQSERSRWLLFDEYNGRNATGAYVELEWE